MQDPKQCICVLAHHTQGYGPGEYMKANIILQLKRKKPQHELDCLTKRKTIAALVLSICQNDHWPLPDTFFVQVLQYCFIRCLKSKVQRELLTVNPWQHLHLQLERETVTTALNGPMIIMPHSETKCQVFPLLDFQCDAQVHSSHASQQFHICFLQSKSQCTTKKCNPS